MWNANRISQVTVVGVISDFRHLFTRYFHIFPLKNQWLRCKIHEDLWYRKYSTVYDHCMLILGLSYIILPGFGLNNLFATYTNGQQQWRRHIVLVEMTLIALTSPCSEHLGKRHFLWRELRFTRVKNADCVNLLELPHLCLEQNYEKCHRLSTEK